MDREDLFGQKRELNQKFGSQGNRRPRLTKAEQAHPGSFTSALRAPLRPVRIPIPEGTTSDQGQIATRQADVVGHSARSTFRPNHLARELFHTARADLPARHREILALARTG